MNKMKIQPIDISKYNDMTLLTLTLKAEWFDMIAKGIKTTEYREIKAYWTKKLAYCDLQKEHPEDNKYFAEDMDFDISQGHDAYNVFQTYRCKFKPLDIILFNRGYGKYRNQLLFHCKEVEIGLGKPMWGAEPGRLYYCLRLGEEIKRNF